MTEVARSNMSRLQDRVVIITGAVGNLGRAVAERVQAQGGRTILVDRSSDWYACHAARWCRRQSMRQARRANLLLVTA
jgi:NAD(P)-dependent dehydrogenase (short-subunit alcohol dehydrogenase family)